MIGMTKSNARATKRTRKGGPRRKTGCPTCRARHVKCDERKPSCLNCTSTGRKCDGYERASVSNIQQTLSLFEVTRLCASKTSPWNDSQVALAPTLGLPSNEQSNIFFHSFLHGCVPSLTEAMDSEFWRRTIQRSSSSPALQHAAVAFGATYELRLERQNQQGSLLLSPNGKRLDLLSSLRYANAIQTLRRCITEAFQTPEMLEEVMIACLIFIFMEILRGDDIAAVTHLDGALKLYSCLHPPRQPLTCTNEFNVTSNMDDALDNVTKSFLRLDIQSVLYMGSRTPWEPDGISIWFHTSDEIPTSFDTFLSARDSLYAHIANIMNFITPPEGAEKCFPGWSPHLDRGFDVYTVFHGSTYRDLYLPKADTKRRHFMHILSRWKSAFHGFLQKRTVNTPEALAGCSLLRLAYYTTRIKLATAYTDDECRYDEQLPSFKNIVERAKAYQRYTAHVPPSHLPNGPEDDFASNMPRLKPKKNEFNIYSTVCYPLYYAALKCRYKPLRQSALSLLRNTNSEGIWDAAILAKIAEFVTSVEDNFIDPEFQNVPTDSSPFGIPEASRIHCLSLNIDKDRRIVWLRYSRRATDTQGQISRDPLKRWRIDDTILNFQVWYPTKRESIEPRQSVPGSPSSANLSWETRTLSRQSPRSQC